MFSVKFVRATMMAFACMVLAACTQTSTSTYSGDFGSSVNLSKDARQKKIKASRERARKAKSAKRDAFLAKRKASSKAKNKKSVKRAKKKTSRKTVSRKKKKALKKRASLRKKSKASKKKRVARKVTKGRKQRLKKSRKAFVPSVSRRAGRIRVNAPWKCVPKRLKSVIYQVRKRWGSVTINSTHRSKRRNRLVGGKRRSMHLGCRAVDFRVHGNTRGLLTWLKRHPSVGGYKRYRSGFFHIDTGPKRTW